MNERYTYDYNVGWNVENEYINSLNVILEKYANQNKVLQEIYNSIMQIRGRIENNNNITEEQIRQWYNEDYLLNDSLLVFDTYKKDILDSINQRNKTLGIELSNKNDEYFICLKDLLNIKAETRQKILTRKKEIELLLSEKKIDLSIILLERQKIKPEYDENRKIINSDKLIDLNQKYDYNWLEIRKIEHALDKLQEMFNLMKVTEEEQYDLKTRGLNHVYEQNEQREVEQEQMPVEYIVSDEKITLEGIIYKICGDKSFNDSQSSRYMASKIKVFNKPEKNNLGISYKIVSMPRMVIAIIPKTAMKVYGLFLSKKTKDLFTEIEERANSLTDKEVEVLLNEYKGSRAQSFRLPKGFNNAVKPRVNLYVAKKVAKINEQINDNLLKINHCEKIISTLNDRLNSEESSEIVKKINEVIETSYATAYSLIKDLISLQIEGNNLQNGNGLHSFEEELKALDTKLNYVGGRFSKTREYDPMLISKISAHSQKIEYSLDPKEVVDSYIEREKIYKENSNEKRSMFNLGSKVTAGKLDYRPFVESLNYGNDPFIRDLITSILVVSSAASLINNINNSIANKVDIDRQNKIIDDANSKILDSNKAGAEQQEFINNIRNSGQTIEKGIVYDIRHTEGSIENLAERAIGDKHGWHMGNADFKADDAIHHLETSNLSLNNTEALLDLSSKYSTGAITYAEYLKEIQALKEETTSVYESYIKDLSGYIEGYAQSHPNFDYTAVLSSLKHAASNPSDSVELTDFITDLYERSLNVSDIESLELIESTLNLTAPSFVPNILTLVTVAAKTTQEYVDSSMQNAQDFKKTSEIRELINNLKTMKAELTEEDIREIEKLLN